jgi:hypothetical protein
MGLQPEYVVTTQRTSKRFKLMLLVGYVAMALAACPSAVAWTAVLNEWPMVSRDQQLPGRLVWASFVCLCNSLAWIALVKGLMWWYHE